MGLNCFCFCGVALRENQSECTRAQLSLSDILWVKDPGCDTGSEFGRSLKGFSSAGIGRNGSLRYCNAKADWNSDIMKSSPPSVRLDEK